MSHSEFIAWVESHTPQGCYQEDFIRLIAMFGAVWLEQAALHSGQPVSAIVEQAFSAEPVNDALAALLMRGSHNGTKSH